MTPTLYHVYIVAVIALAVVAILRFSATPNHELRPFGPWNWRFAILVTAPTIVIAMAGSFTGDYLGEVSYIWPVVFAGSTVAFATASWLSHHIARKLVFRHNVT